MTESRATMAAHNAWGSSSISHDVDLVASLDDLLSSSDLSSCSLTTTSDESFYSGCHSSLHNFSSVASGTTGQSCNAAVLLPDNLALFSDPAKFVFPAHSIHLQNPSFQSLTLDSALTPSATHVNPSILHSERDLPISTNNFSDIDPRLSGHSPEPSILETLSGDEDAEGEIDQCYTNSFTTTWNFQHEEKDCIETAEENLDSSSFDAPIPSHARDGQWEELSSLSSPHRELDQSTTKIEPSNLIVRNELQSIQQRPASNFASSPILRSPKIRKKNKKRKIDYTSTDESDCRSNVLPKTSRRHGPKSSTHEERKVLRARSNTYNTRSSRRGLALEAERETQTPAGLMYDGSSNLYRLRRKSQVTPSKPLSFLRTTIKLEPTEDGQGYQDSDSPSGGGASVQESEASQSFVESFQPPRFGSSMKPGLSQNSSASTPMPSSMEEEEEESLPLWPAKPMFKSMRTFPPDFPVNLDFPLFYQRYHVPSSVTPEVLGTLVRGVDLKNCSRDLEFAERRARQKLGTFNKPRSILDLYTPRFVRGVGANKEGMCPICYEEGSIEFFKTKFSAYNYHLQNAHGISATTGLPFTPPIKFRHQVRHHAQVKERSEVLQGLCHVCKKYVNVEGIKLGEVKVPEIYWWKHAQACHRSSPAPPPGHGGYFVQSEWFELVCRLLDQVGGYRDEIERLLDVVK